jgi:hypothetical protein
MSLLYECINGIIQGGILDSNDESASGDEIAALCVSKLRGMIMVEGDANRKYLLLKLLNYLFITLYSEIRCTACIQQNSLNASFSCGTAGGCHYGVHR